MGGERFEQKVCMFYLLYFRKWKCCQVSTNQISEKDSRQQDNKKRERERERERIDDSKFVKGSNPSLTRTCMPFSFPF
jgi:hypothetical protein